MFNQSEIAIMKKGLISLTYRNARLRAKSEDLDEMRELDQSDIKTLTLLQKLYNLN